MINDQQSAEFLSPAQQPAPGHHVDRQGRGRLRRLVISTNLLLVLLFTVSGSAALLTPRAHHPALATRLAPHLQQPTPTTQATLSAQTAMIASQVDSLLTDQVAHQQFSGSVLIAQDGQVLLSRGYSMADWNHQVVNTPHTKFYLGSTTKQFTAMAILILQQQGKLHVQDPLCSYIPQCPPEWQPVTIHEVLTHTSGIPQLDDSGLPNTSLQSWIASFNGVPLVFTPGSEFSYCNVCYQILGYVIEQVSGEPYSVFLQQAIFAPLQMSNTGFDPHYLSLPDHAVGYASWQVEDISLGWDLPPEWSFLSASGLLYSTVEDMYRWDQALSAHTLISQQSLDEAFTPYVTSQYAGSSYGYGWFIAQAPLPGHRLIWHDGKVEGFRSFIGRYPDDRVTIIVLSNLATLDEMALAKTVEQIVFAHT